MSAGLPDPTAPVALPQQAGAFTLIDLMHLLIRDGCLAGCTVGGWLVGGWVGVVAAVPVGWLVGWAIRHAVVFLLAVALKLTFGGTIWPPRKTAEPARAPDRGGGDAIG